MRLEILKMYKGKINGKMLCLSYMDWRVPVHFVQKNNEHYVYDQAKSEAATTSL